MHLLFVRVLKSPQNPVEKVEQESVASPPAGIFVKRSALVKMC